MTIRRGVTLLNEHLGPDEHHLKASWVDDIGLVVEGHDLGPGTAPVSDDGEYEFSYEIRLESIPTLLERLGADEHADIISVLRDWTGPRAYEFERLCSDLRSNFWCWP